MKRILLAGLLVVTGAAMGRAEAASEYSTQGGRYQMFANPHANRVYVLDSQTGRVFQLANYKDVGKEILEEVPYVYGTTRLCTPGEYERAPDRCFNRNFDYMKSLVDLKREQNNTAPGPTPSPSKADTKP